MGFITNRRNKKWATKLGWEPSDFGSFKFDDLLSKSIQEFQQLVVKQGHPIEVDGICGPETYRHFQKYLATENRNNGTSILVNGRWVDIGHPTEYRPLPNNCVKSVKTRQPTNVVVHHDVCYSAAGCYNVLKAARYSTHFVIDNDGKIIQFADTRDICHHAGVSYYRDNKGKKKKYKQASKLNATSIGIDFSNAWYVSANSEYEKRGFGKRKILTASRIHGQKIGSHLDMYPVQIEAFKNLAVALNKIYSIPLTAPTDEQGNFIRGWVEKCMKAEHEGFQVHFNSSINKIDTDIDLANLMDECKKMMENDNANNG